MPAMRGARCLAVAAAAFVWVVGSSAVFAHGGGYSAPPMPRFPGSGGTPGSPGTPRGATPGGGGGVTPGSMPVAPPPTSASAYDETWQSWWEFNRWSWLPDREEIRLRLAARLTAGSRAGVGETGEGARSDAGRDRELVATTRIVPFLLGLLTPERHVRDDVRASAVIALGKAVRGPAAISAITCMPRSK